jgi:hypothetical protein
MKDTQQFYGHGKLMLTGEYIVLDGAKALALPTRFGQYLRVKQQLTATNHELLWVAMKNNGAVWLNLSFDTRTLSCIGNTGEEAKRLESILQICRAYNPDFLNTAHDYAVETRLEFPNNWGLGSSSTFIYSIAQWAQVDPILLLGKTIGGSGYDVACAGSELPIVFHINEGIASWQQVEFNPPFREQIYFVHLGEKQLSSAGIKHYKSRDIKREDFVTWVNVVTDSMLGCATLTKFNQLLEEHEQYISDAIGMEPLKHTMFKDFEGGVKSLGAWGGDFALLTYEGGKGKLQEYLAGKKLNTVLGWNEMILPYSTN